MTLDKRSQPAVRVRYVDFADLEAKMTGRAVADARSAPGAHRGRRIITTVDRVAEDVRANVQDAAKAVLAWVAAVTDAEADETLTDVLNRCLKPGPDIERINYTQLAAEITRTLDVDITAKRVRSAIRHLRKAHEGRTHDMAKPSLKQKLDRLHDRLTRGYASIVDQRDEHDALRREMSLGILGAVRAAAGRVIDFAYGEGIPTQVDVDELESRFLDFVRDQVRAEAVGDVEADLKRLLLTLGAYDLSAESDMRLVVDGSRVVADLAGPDSLPGVMAQLNVLVAGRELIDDELYVAEMSRLAQTAEALHDDPATKSLLNWIRRQPDDQRIPSPLRVASYCRNNAATRLGDRVFMGTLDDASTWLDRADEHVQAMRERDSGFELIKVTELVLLTARAQHTGDASGLHAHFKSLGETVTLELLEKLARFDNCAALVQTALHHAVAALPALKNKLINIR